MQFPADHPSEVSISDAAKMVGVTRATLYEHMKDKKISVIDKDTSRPKINVSELVRVYGDKLKPLTAANNKSAGKQSGDRDLVAAAENAALKEKLQMIEQERDRERRLLTAQIDSQQAQIENLQESLKKEQDTVGKVTAMLTDQRSDAEKKANEETAQAKKWAELEKTVQTLAENQNQSFWQKLFGQSRKAS
jgi:AcrR family transcriptional regulator